MIPMKPIDQARAWAAGHPGLVRRGRRLRRPLRIAMLRGATVSETWGFDRGTPVDRFYVERFLEANADQIRGHVLEVKDDAYTRRFGTGVDHVDIVDIDVANPAATIHADLAHADGIPDATFDCFVLTQTLHVIYDVAGVLRHAHRILKPRGVLLATVPVLSPLRGDPDQPIDFWRMTPVACRRLFGEAFGSGQVEVEAHGNLQAAIAFLAGAAHEELPAARLERSDPRHPLLCTIRAVRAP